MKYLKFLYLLMLIPSSLFPQDTQKTDGVLDPKSMIFHNDKLTDDVWKRDRKNAVALPPAVILLTKEYAKLALMVTRANAVLPDQLNWEMVDADCPANVFQGERLTYYHFGLLSATTKTVVIGVDSASGVYFVGVAAGEAFGGH